MTTTLPPSRPAAADLPVPEAVGERAMAVHRVWTGHPLFGRLREATLLHMGRWTTFTGHALISGWDVDRDGGDLFVEAIRVLALRAAVYEQTGNDEWAAELAVAPPIEETVNAVVAQTTVVLALTRETMVGYVHAPDRAADEGWDTDDYTERCYRAAWPEGLDPRYWIPRDEVTRRLAVLGELVASVGFDESGRSHEIIYSDEVD